MLVECLRQKHSWTLNTVFVWLLFAYEQTINICHLQVFFEGFLTISENFTNNDNVYWMILDYMPKKIYKHRKYFWALFECLFNAFLNKLQTIESCFLMFIDFISKNIHKYRPKPYCKHYTCKKLTNTFACIWTNYKHLTTWNVLWMFPDYTCRYTRSAIKHKI